MENQRQDEAKENKQRYRRHGETAAEIPEIKTVNPVPAQEKPE